MLKGGYKAVLKELTILGKYNDINFQARFEVEYEIGKVSFPDILDDMTDRLRTAGVQPPVGKALERRDRDVRTNATGRHPDDDIPFLDSFGNPVPCPNCDSPLLVRKGVAGLKSKVPGRPWTKYICGNCDYSKWKD
jgi:hypothetical protein